LGTIAGAADTGLVRVKPVMSLPLVSMTKFIPRAVVPPPSMSALAEPLPIFWSAALNTVTVMVQSPAFRGMEREAPA
jgi:hypothetical protein